ncbi:MAG TPA: hypothetical protein VE733_24325, partial [Streptosporangiaceae bacterium]|nr:hypothetical protein [Streptosporangiaceae bacterium]
MHPPGQADEDLHPLIRPTLSRWLTWASSARGPGTAVSFWLPSPLEGVMNAAWVGSARATRPGRRLRGRQRLRAA